ncbi:MAG: hypothetical protein KatS3mg122_0818 [Caldimonas sp.]|nr:MAG: hypothetical protein KatS3mg122_0818 [Caldimonas sp.]
MAEATGFMRFLRETLHHGDRVERFGGDGAEVGHPVLAGARQLAHVPADRQRRQHQQQQQAQHLGHHVRVGDDQHHQRPASHQQVAQAHGQAGAHHGLHQRGVGAQAREHFAAARRLEEFGALADHVPIHRGTQIGRDAFTQPADQVVACGREQAQGRADGEQFGEMTLQRQQALRPRGVHQPLVDQAAQGHRQHQGGQRCQHQKARCGGHTSAVGAHERCQLAQGGQAAYGRGWGCSSEEGMPRAGKYLP